MKIISSPTIPKPAGHYSTLVEHNGIIYISGQLPKDLQTGKVPEGIEAQTQLVLENIRFLLKEAGSDINKIIQVRIFVTDINHWAIVNDIYAAFFGEHKPARIVVPVKEFKLGCLLEIEGVAAV